MKKIIAVFLTALLLTGCGTASEETAVIENSADESSIEAVPVMESKEDTTEEVREYPEDELMNINYVFANTVDLSSVKTQGNIVVEKLEVFSAHYEEGEISGNACYATPEGKLIAFSPEAADKVNKLFKKGYDSFIEENRSVVDGAYLELAKECADAGKGPDDLPLEPLDISEKLPDKIELMQEDKTIELDVIGAELGHGMSTVIEGTTSDAKVPYWKADDGSDNFLFLIVLSIKVPKEQMEPVLSYLDGLIIEEQTSEKEEKAEETTDKEKKADEVPKSTEQKETSVELIGTWYDPTGLSAVQFTFNGDGAGTVDWGGSASAMTYSISGDTVNCQMSNSSYSLKIQGDELSDGESKYVER